MATPKWQPGHLYQPGALVVPRSAPPVSATQATNGDFEGGSTGWTFSGGVELATSGGYSSANCCTVPGSVTGGEALNDAEFIMQPGGKISANCMVQQGASDVDHTRGWVQVHFYDADDNELGDPVKGNIINDGRGGGWNRSSVTATAPASAAYAKVGIGLYQNSADAIWADNLVVNYANQAPPKGLVFKATQAKAGRSANTEPTWPTTTGVEVTDGEVTWEGVLASRVIWEASPILVSSDTEPTWPTDIGGFVGDNTINWEAISRRVEDDNCPPSKVVAIMSSKVFAADEDIVRFSATVNPLDWTTPQDAGYLPTGLQQANANDMAVLAPYRSNLTAFNASSFQNWQVDPDPAAMAILDQMDGIGSTWQHAAQPVGNELFYLSQLGVRSVSIAAGSDNLKAGDVGMPIDPLVQAAMPLDTTMLGPRATYYPSAGQYWLAFDQGVADPVVFVFTLNGGKGKWSRYLFPWSVDAFAQLGNDLYIRHGDVVSKVDEDATDDDGTNFTGLVWWPWLDFGQPGVTKMLEGFDIVGSGTPSVSVGYDQTDTSAFTTPYEVSPDTLTGGIIPLPVAAPTLSVKVSYAGGEAWSLQAVQLYLDDMRGQP